MIRTSQAMMLFTIFKSTPIASGTGYTNLRIIRVVPLINYPSSSFQVLPGGEAFWPLATADWVCPRDSSNFDDGPKLSVQFLPFRLCPSLSPSSFPHSPSSPPPLKPPSTQRLIRGSVFNTLSLFLYYLIYHNAFFPHLSRGKSPFFPPGKQQD